MMRTPIHENLSTSFVNLPKLIRHLRELQFIGMVRVEYASYEGEIIFTGGRKLRAREYDHLTGRIFMGEKAFVRILHRVREPWGRVHIFEAPATAANAVFVDERIAFEARQTIKGRSDTPVEHLLPRRRPAAEPEAVLEELLRTFDQVLKAGRLDFQSAFRNAAGKVSRAFFCLDPASRDVMYEDGRLTVAGHVDRTDLIDGVCRVLLIIIKRLAGEPRQARTLCELREALMLLALDRQRDHEDCSIVKYIDQMLGLE